MDIKNIEKLPEHARNVLEPLIRQLHEIYSDEIISIFVYGSVATSGYDPRLSDINLAVVLKDVSILKLKPALGLVKKALRKKVTAPLFLTPEYIKKSLDTFPMEFMAMKDSRLCLFGDDCLKDIEIKKEDLRRECEYQLKGKLLTIRQAYLEQALNRKGLEKLIKSSFRALMPVFRSVLKMNNGKTPPGDKEEVLCQLSEEFDIDVAAFLEVLRDEKIDGRVGKKDAETFLNDFLIQLKRLSSIVDNMQI